MITSSTPDTWQNLQTEVARILKECGFDVVLEKTIKTARGTVEVDVYAEEFVQGRKYSIVCECKHWKSAVPQSVIHSFRTVVADIGANVGHIVSLNGFQSGAFKASELTNLKLLTWQEFQNDFEESCYESYFSPTIAKKLDPLLTYAEPLLPKWFGNLPEGEKDKYMSLKERYDEFGWAIMSFTPYVRMLKKEAISQLPLSSKVLSNSSIRENVPKELLTKTGYREFLEVAVSFGEKVISQFRAIRDRNAV
tara:strand:- start:932 stop:1684 length:753 start_codon:yes stop_codon:yes gene_type:complete